MPLFSCECRECGEKFEFYSRMIQLNLELRCPKCGGRNITQTQLTPWQDSEIENDDDESLARESS